MKTKWNQFVVYFGGWRGTITAACLMIISRVADTWWFYTLTMLFILIFLHIQSKHLHVGDTVKKTLIDVRIVWNTRKESRGRLIVSIVLFAAGVALLLGVTEQLLDLI